MPHNGAADANRLIVSSMTEQAVERLSAEIKACVNCAARFAKTATAHAPNPVFQFSSTARLCVAGQAPGIRVQHSGRPFTDPSGVRLRSWMGIGEDVFYDPARLIIAPMAFCFPGYNAKKHDLPPPPDCAKIWRRDIFTAMPQIELIVTVGRSALDWHRPELRKTSLGEIVSGGLIDGDIQILPLPHPSWRNNAWLKGNPWFETKILPVLRAEVSRLTG